MRDVGTLPIETSRLLLRKFSENDATLMIQNWASDYMVTKWLTWEPYEDINIAKYKIMSWMNNYHDKAFYQWAIVLKDTEDTVGSISAHHYGEAEKECMEISYCLGRNFWEKGIMTEAVKAVIDFLFRTVGIRLIMAQHAEENIGSGNVLKKCGMHYVDSGYAQLSCGRFKMLRYYIENTEHH